VAGLPFSSVNPLGSARTRESVAIVVIVINYVGMHIKSSVNQRRFDEDG
jgi:hypothetical protein